MRKLLYLDSSYTYEGIKQKHLEHVLAVRLLDGYFGKVWSAHPIDTLPGVTEDLTPWGKSVWEDLNRNHVFIRGRYGRYPCFRRAKTFNAALAILSFTREMIKLVKRENIKVIRAGSPLLTGILALIISRFTGARLLVRISANNEELRKETNECLERSVFRWIWLEERFERLVISEADIVLVPNRNYEVFARRNGATDETVVRTNYGNLIDPLHLVPPSRRSRIQYESFFGPIAKRRWVGHIGRLDRVKRVEEAYDAFVLLTRMVEDVGLCFVGDGPLKERLEERAVGDGLIDRVVILGDLDQTKLSRGMRFFSAVVSPRTGRALAEAAFGARPIVGFDLDWQAELIESGKSGLLVPDGDIEGMADALAILLRNTDFAIKIGREARRRAFDLLSPSDQTAAEVAAYQKVIR